MVQEVMMSTPATRFLQQENSRLKRENESLKQKNLDLQHYLDLIRELYWVNQQMAFAEDPLDVLDQMLQKVMTVVGARDSSLSCLDEETDELVFVLVQGDLRDQLPGFRFNSEAGISGWVVSNQKPIIVNNPRQDWRFSLEVDQEFNFSTRSIVSMPVLLGDRPLGVINLVNKQDNEFTEADITLLLSLHQIAVAAIQSITTLPAPRQREEMDDLFGA
jgi:GAF domain-containing protein